MTPAEFQKNVEEGLEDAPKKAKKPEIENVIEWISRLIATKDAEGVVGLIDAAGTDEAKLNDAVAKVADLRKERGGKDMGVIEELLENPVDNKDAVIEKVKDLLTGSKSDPGIEIAGATTELSDSYKSLIDWLNTDGSDTGRRDLELKKIRELDNKSLAYLEVKLNIIVSSSDKFDESKIKLMLSQIKKQKIERREVKRILTDEDAKKINSQAKEMMGKIKQRSEKGLLGNKAEAVNDQKHLRESLKIMAQIKQASEVSNISWDEYIQSGVLKPEDKQLLIAGMSVIEREVGSNYQEYEELYVLMKQVRDSWNEYGLAEAYEQRQKHMVEHYGTTPRSRAQDSERMMKERLSEKFLREHPELLDSWSEFGDFTDNLMSNPGLVDVRDYMKGSRMGLNVNFEMLVDEKNSLKQALDEAGLGGIIDMSEVDAGGVPKLKDTGFTVEDRRRAQNIILQELLKEVRGLVADGVEGSAMMYDPRATPYLTYLSIRGVSPDLKQTVGAHMKLHYLEYMWRNGYVDEEVYGRLIKFFSEQGPEYRLHEQLKIREKFVLVGKEGKEVDIGEFNLYDFEKYLTRNVSAEDKAHFGMPNDVDRTYATALATKVTPDGMAGDRKTFLKTMLKQHWGEAKYLETVGKFDSEADFLDKFMGRDGRYNDYIHKSYIYWIGNGRLGEVVGNGNLKSNKSFELAQGIPEYYYKRDPRLMIMFLLVYKPQLIPDVLTPIMRMGITSLAAMYGEEIAGHFISLSDSNQGAPGIGSTFMKGASEVHQKAWRLMWEDSLYDYDEYHEKHGHAQESIYFEGAGKKKPEDGHDALVSRRTNTDTIIKLKKHLSTKNDDFFNSIKWEWAAGTKDADGKWAGGKYEHNVELVNFLRNPEKSNREKMEYFVDHFGDDYFITDGLKAKRGDAWMKYMGKYQDEFFKAVIEYATNPEVETMAKLVGIVNSIVGNGKVGPFVERMREVLYYVSKSRMTGEKYDMLMVGNDGRVEFDENRWVGSNQGEFPMPKIVTVRNMPSMNIKKNSVLAHRGLEGKVYEPLLERVMLRDMRAANAFPDLNEYNKAVWKWRMGLLWEADRGVLLNMLSLVTGRSLSEFISIGLFELPPHVFWEWFFENSEKSWETSMKVFAGASH